MAAPVSITRQPWGGIRVRVGKYDVSHLRGAPVVVNDWSSVDPGGHDSASISFPQLTRPDRAGLGTGDLAWYRKGATVRIDHIDDARTVLDNLYTGPISHIAWGDVPTMVCDGNIIGPASRQVNNPPLAHDLNDIGLTVARLVTSLPGGTPVHPDYLTGIEVDRPGSPSDSIWGRIIDLLAMAQKRNGDQYTLLPDDDDPNLTRVILRDLATHHYTAYLGIQGVADDLEWDLASETTAWWGEGQRSDGGRWYNYVYPYIGDQVPPDFPGVMAQGDTNADTTTGDGVTVLARSVARFGLGFQEGWHGVFDAKIKDAVETAQDAAGLPVTGVVNLATWNALFSAGVDNQSLYGAKRLPLVQQSKTRRYNRTASGVISGLNESYDPDAPAVEEFVGFGTNIDKADAREWCRAQQAKQAGSDEWAGSVVFTTDPAECSRFQMRAGKNIYNPLTGEVFHIARATVNYDQGTVSCDVSTRGRDYLDLATLRERNHAARANPAKRWRAQLSRRSGQAQDMATGWDYEGGAGIVPATDCQAEVWKSIPVFAGRVGSVSSIRLKTSPNTEFCMLISAREVTGGRMQRLVPDPLGERTEKGSWVTDDNSWRILFGRDGEEGDFGGFADRRLILYAAGTPTTPDDEPLPCGYWPKENAGKPDNNSLGTNLTGEWQDDGGFDYYTSAGNPFLWLSVWCRTTTTIHGRFTTSMVDGGQ